MNEAQQAKVVEARRQPFFFGVKVEEGDDGSVTVSGLSMPDGGYRRWYTFDAEGEQVAAGEDGPFITGAMLDRVGGRGLTYGE